MPDNKQGECRLGQNDQKLCILKPIFANKLINKFSLLMFDFEDMFPEATFVNSKKKLRNSASSFHWLSSSIFNVRRSSSRIRDISSHLYYLYDVSVAELSPVYCCLVELYFAI